VPARKEPLQQKAVLNMLKIKNMQQIQHESVEEEPPSLKKELREKIDSIFPDSLMMVLAGLMVPIVLSPIVLKLSPAVSSSLKLLDYVILGIFIAEYILKVVLARKPFKYVMDPWHLLDLFIILLPFIILVPAISNNIGFSSPLLRLLRIIRVVAVGGRAVDRKRQMSRPLENEDARIDTPAEIRVIDGSLDNTLKEVSFNNLGNLLTSATQSWIDISAISDEQIKQLADMMGIPAMILASELINESYPRVDYFEHYSMIFARVADFEIPNKGISRLSVSRCPLLVICQGQNIITLSRDQTGVFDKILEDAGKIHESGEPLTVTILYALFKHILEKDKRIIRVLEQELMALENIPLKERPSNFLEATFHLRKEVNQLVPSLLHLKEIISEITTKRLALNGFDTKHEKIFDILLDEVSYLHETASNARDNLQSLVDLYINTTSYDMNKVMRVIAVMTALGIVPTMVVGALGSNVAGNPWDIQLWQVFVILGITMLMLGWVFYRLGWLK